MQSYQKLNSTLRAYIVILADFQQEKMMLSCQSKTQYYDENVVTEIQNARYTRDLTYVTFPVCSDEESCLKKRVIRSIRRSQTHEKLIDDLTRTTPIQPTASPDGDHNRDLHNRHSVPDLSDQIINRTQESRSVVKPII